MKFAAYALGVAGLCWCAHAQTIWSPRIDRTTASSTLVHYPGQNPSALATQGPMALPAGYFVSGLEFAPDHRLFATVQGPEGSMAQGLYSVNAETGATTQVGPPIGLASNEVITDLAWNPVTHRFIGVATPISGGLTSRLVAFDIHTGAIISSTTLHSNVSVLHVGVTCRPSGEYLLMEIFNSWVSRVVDDEAIWLGNILSFKPVFNQGIGTDFQTGTIWYASFRLINALQGTGQPALRTVDPTSGVDTFIGNLPGGSNALYTDAAVEPAEIHCAADLTHDQLVEDGDFVVFVSQYDALECGTPAMTGGCSGDLNFDGVVDDADFVIFAAAYDALVCP